MAKAVKSGGAEVREKDISANRGAYVFGMKGTGARAARGMIKDFCRDNKKSLISFAAVFALGIVLGIFITISAAGGEFERVARADMEFGAVKVFFSTSFTVLIGYGVVLLSACAQVLAIASLLAYALLGYYFGKYMCLLVAVYGATGVLNMVVIYIPFFLVTFLLMCVAGAKAASAVGCDRLKRTALTLAKIYGLNIAANFVIFVIVGAFSKVIVVGF